jgi:phage shock protein A
MERIKDEATISKISEGKYSSRILVEEHLNAEDMVKVKESLNNAIKNIDQQIKQAKDQVKQIKEQVPALKRKQEEFRARLKKASHLFEEATKLAPPKEETDGNEKA